MIEENRITIEKLSSFSRKKKISFIYKSLKFDLEKLSTYWMNHWNSFHLFTINDAIFYSLTKIPIILERYDVIKYPDFHKYLINHLSIHIRYFFKSNYKPILKQTNISIFTGGEMDVVDPVAFQSIIYKLNKEYFLSILKKEYIKLAETEKKIFMLFLSGYSYKKVVNILNIPRRPIRKVMYILRDIANKIK
ncbi:hypothetical protein [Mycoplasma phocimorsus]|uniref:hypothetical protein n=1 Tax=Mycoplasma phocimorsus TaxID=3045839 RepID=UPI0024C09E32|nr:hypothetical protein [Mycoplasma phocimorsus]MDJ1647523.1 hypothetical protein [Mycoplasma phocimorsus]